MKNKRQDALVKWAVENVRHRSHHQSDHSESYYLSSIGGGNLTLRISDHLRLIYSEKLVSVLFNLDGSMCAVYGTKLLPLKDVGEAKQFIRDFEFFATVNAGKSTDEKYAEFCRVSNTPAYAALKELSTKAQRRRAVECLREIAEGKEPEKTEGQVLK